MDEAQLLSNAIAAIQNGDHFTGRQLLTLILSQNPNHEQALRWMIEVAPDPPQKLAYARRAAQAHPHSEPIAQLLSSIETEAWRNMDYKQLYAETQQATRVGDKGTARRIANFVLQSNPNNEHAWLVLADLSDDAQSKRECLQRVLEINPKNKRALSTIRLLNSRHAPGPSLPAHIPKPTPLQNAITIFFLCMLGLMLIGRAALNNLHGQSMPTPIARKTVSIGDEAVLYDSSGSIIASNDLDSLERLYDARSKNDREGFEEALLTGGIRYLPSGLRVRVLDRGSFLGVLWQVRVIDQNSDFYNLKVWCDGSYLKPAGIGSDD